MFKKLILVLILIFSLVGCNLAQNTEASKKNNTINPIKFVNFYKGFATIKESEEAAFPKGTLVITSYDSWHNFMDKYVPGIPYNEPINFDSEYLVYDAYAPAKPTYSIAIDIKNLRIQDNELISNSDIKRNNEIYVQNISGITHIYVNIVKVNKNDIPKDIKNIYRYTRPTINQDPSLYTNTQYGFSFSLPKSWKGYSIVNSTWEGLAIGGDSGEKVVETGPMLYIRHPQWTSKNPRQDIPIMVFTLDQWNSLKEEKFHIGAAPIGPSELGRNSKYAFALPARYNYAFPKGYEEVEDILKGNPLKMFQSN